MKSRKPSIPYIIWMVVFTMIPIIMIGFTAFTDKNGNFSFQAFTNAFYYTNIFVKSLWIALISTAICLVLAYPLAYLLTRMKESTQNTLIMLLMIPMWMNFLIRTYSWMTILGDSGVINTILNALGIHSLKLINNGAAVILGMVYNFLPYMILPIFSVLTKLDNSLVEAAQDLGSNKFEVMRKVIIPLSKPGILSGITMVFVPCVSTFYITQKLGGGQVVLIGDVIETQFQSANNYNLGAALSFVLMILIFICLGIMNYFGADEDGDGGVII